MSKSIAAKAFWHMLKYKFKQQNTWCSSCFKAQRYGRSHTWNQCSQSQSSVTWSSNFSTKSSSLLRGLAKEAAASNSFRLLNSFRRNSSRKSLEFGGRRGLKGSWSSVDGTSHPLHEMSHESKLHQSIQKYEEIIFRIDPFRRKALDGILMVLTPLHLRTRERIVTQVSMVNR